MKKIAITILCVSFVISSFSQTYPGEKIFIEKSDLRKSSPNRIVLRIGAGVFSNYTYDKNLENPKFRMENFTYSGMLGYRSSFNSDNYRFSSTGRDMNRGNVVAIFYQSGTLNNIGLGELEKKDKKIFIESLGQDVRFTELQVGVVWREFLRISGGKGTVKTLKTLEEYTNLENVSYHLFTAGVNLRFGRLCPTLNWTLISADNFKTAMSRFDIQICVNMYFWKKILHKDKHLIED